ncbi:uncharacterized protein LOC143181603 [Calliopsis andreniformis]|uniref:uncharacterized protein LOC143181603 n=1 Tax=Calliopsis andreniformis TaxID=337506 RepID=UPI003FCE123F
METTVRWWVSFHQEGIRIGFKLLSASEVLNFPEITEKDFKILFIGSYQLSQAISYLAELVDKENNISPLKKIQNVTPKKKMTDTEDIEMSHKTPLEQLQLPQLEIRGRHQQTAAAATAATTAAVASAAATAVAASAGATAAASSAAATAAAASAGATAAAATAAAASTAATAAAAAEAKSKSTKGRTKLRQMASPSGAKESAKFTKTIFTCDKYSKIINKNILQ